MSASIREWMGSRGTGKGQKIRVGKRFLKGANHSIKLLTAKAKLLYHLGFLSFIAIWSHWSLNMYAVIKTGGKQYRVAAGEKLKIDQLPADIGAEIVLNQVLLVADGDNLKMGRPLVTGASVQAKVLAQGRHDKVRIFKLRRRKHYQKHQGHRQNFTEIEITGITG
jgi:large subunit ribosomal protein L21